MEGAALIGKPPGLRQQRVVEKLAQGDNVVVVGRAAPAVLSQRDALHVKLVAPKPVRVRRAMARLNTGEADAMRMLDETDAARARYHKQYYERDWYDPTNYHMVLNTDALGIEGTAKLIVEWVTGNR